MIEYPKSTEQAWHMMAQMETNNLELIVKWAISMGLSTGHADDIEMLLDELTWQIEGLRGSNDKLQAVVDRLAYKVPFKFVFVGDESASQMAAMDLKARMEYAAKHASK